MVAAPHTSNWDFVLTMAMTWAVQIEPLWLGKKEMFAGPFAPIFRKMGGIAVDRENPAGLAQRLTESAKTSKSLAIMIPPEATRAKKTYWKSGFRRIAIGAEIPIVLCFLDKPTRTGGWGPMIWPSDDVVADMDQIRAFYADKHGMKPGRFTTPLLKEEESGEEAATGESGEPAE